MIYSPILLSRSTIYVFFNLLSCLIVVRSPVCLFKYCLWLSFYLTPHIRKHLVPCQLLQGVCCLAVISFFYYLFHAWHFAYISLSIIALYAVLYINLLLIFPLFCKLFFLVYIMKYFEYRI